MKGINPLLSTLDRYGKAESNGANAISGGVTGARSTRLSQNNKKMRVLPNGVKSVQVEDIPSDISDDEWGEI